MRHNTVIRDTPRDGTGGTRDRARDEAFVRAVHDKHGVFLLRVTTGLLWGDGHQAQDLLQEAVLRAWQNADILDPEAEGIRPWLVTVVRNLVIDGYRARKARPSETVDTALNDLPGPESMEPALTKKLVREALADLTLHHREILVHVEFLDQSVARTAETLGIPPGTVKSRNHLALKALRAALAERGYTP
ncbi:sigma-70 family RNA polymerase sigma factor [Streptomyces sp. MBT65]|uniref:sigma-70 family RNA polymerase sigma factor n=1 Tax=Streptomyces sp. MBT65 TaxID=1488395 RepID=UPI00190B3229|nr:sigma-70 family RNA polymerase sigma factor [Streptomyces sp. MBT65]MBK3575900.1 sigma-70 family RNA polymerase sigma factor [Streptomyces sp. MBT65]